MRKNIEETVESVLPDNIHDTHRFILTCREQLKQALTEGKLVVPMSEEEIFKTIDAVNHNEYSSKCGFPTKARHYARELYKAQFGGNK